MSLENEKYLEFQKLEFTVVNTHQNKQQTNAKLAITCECGRKMTQAKHAVIL